MELNGVCQERFYFPLPDKPGPNVRMGYAECRVLQQKEVLVPSCTLFNRLEFFLEIGAQYQSPEIVQDTC